MTATGASTPGLDSLSTPRPIPTPHGRCSTKSMSPLLPRVLPSPEGKPLPPKDTAAAFRAFARDLAAGRRWGSAEADFLAGLFDQLAPEWDAAQATGRDDPLRDALTLAGVLPYGSCLEVGSGTGQFTRLLTSVFPAVISLDLSEQMLRQAAGRSLFRVRARRQRPARGRRLDRCLRRHRHAVVPR